MTNALSGTWTLAGGSNITLSQSGNAVSIIGQPQIDGMDANYGNLNTGGYVQLADEMWWNVHPNSAPMAIAQNTSYMFPIRIPYPVSVGFLRLPGSVSHGASTSIGTTANTTVSVSMLTTLNIQLFADGQGANSLSLQEVMSTSAGWTYRVSVQMGANTNALSWSQQLTYPMSTTAQANFATNTNISSASVSINTNSVTQFTGPKVIDIPWSTLIPAGQYWMAIGSSTQTATQVAAMSVFTSQSTPLSLYNYTQSNLNSIGELGVASDQSNQFPMGLGSFSNAGNGKTASLAFNNISLSSSQPVFAVAFHRTA